MYLITAYWWDWRGIMPYLYDEIDFEQHFPCFIIFEKDDQIIQLYSNVKRTNSKYNVFKTYGLDTFLQVFMINLRLDDNFLKYINNVSQRR